MKRWDIVLIIDDFNPRIEMHVCFDAIYFRNNMKRIFEFGVTPSTAEMAWPAEAAPGITIKYCR